MLGHLLTHDDAPSKYREATPRRTVPGASKHQKPGVTRFLLQLLDLDQWQVAAPGPGIRASTGRISLANEVTDGLGEHLQFVGQIESLKTARLCPLTGLHRFSISAWPVARPVHAPNEV